MIREAWDWLQRQIHDGPAVGTPENPEILEPGQSPRAPRPRGRLRLIFTLLAAMLVISAPAAFTVWTCIWLIQTGTAVEGALFAWILLVLFAPITLVLTSAALAIDLMLLLAIIAIASGKRHLAVQFGTRRPTHVHPTREARPPRMHELT